MPEDRSVLERPGRPPDSTEAYGPDADQLIDWYGCAGDDAPLVLLIHGGYWRPEYDRSHARPAAGAIADAGFRTALVEYRRSPGRPDDTLADIASAVAHCCARHPDVPVILMGHSAGGHLALITAARPGPDVGGCLALAPVASLQRAEELALDDGAVTAFLGSSADERPDLDPFRLPAPECPVGLLHGDADSLVPVSISQEYARLHGIPLRTLPGTGHFEVIDPASTIWPDVMGELERIAAARGIE